MRPHPQDDAPPRLRLTLLPQKITELATPSCVCCTHGSVTDLLGLPHPEAIANVETIAVRLDAGEHDACIIISVPMLHCLLKGMARADDFAMSREVLIDRCEPYATRSAVRKVHAPQEFQCCDQRKCDSMFSTSSCSVLAAPFLHTESQPACVRRRRWRFLGEGRSHTSQRVYCTWVAPRRLLLWHARCCQRRWRRVLARTVIAHIGPSPFLRARLRRRLCAYTLRVVLWLPQLREREAKWTVIIRFRNHDVHGVAPARICDARRVLPIPIDDARRVVPTRIGACWFR